MNNIEKLLIHFRICWKKSSKMTALRLCKHASRNFLEGRLEYTSCGHRMDDYLVSMSLWWTLLQLESWCHIFKALTLYVKFQGPQAKTGGYLNRNTLHILQFCGGPLCSHEIWESESATCECSIYTCTYYAGKMGRFVWILYFLWLVLYYSGDPLEHDLLQQIFYRAQFW